MFLMLMLPACWLSLSQPERRSQQVAAWWCCGAVVLWQSTHWYPENSQLQSHKQSSYGLSGVSTVTIRAGKIVKYFVIIVVLVVVGLVRLQ